MLHLSNSRDSDTIIVFKNELLQNRNFKIHRNFTKRYVAALLNFVEKKNDMCACVVNAVAAYPSDCHMYTYHGL